MMAPTVIVIGGGASGFFGAIACAQRNPSAKVIILEQHRQLLSKVRISGGGRCNVTHACFDSTQLTRNYPRGQLALKGPFTRFQALDTIAWFEKRGIRLKTEDDGRMFPITDSSETIIDCLLSEAYKSHIQIRTESSVVAIQVQKESNNNAPQFKVILKDGTELDCHQILLATGSNAKVHSMLESLGHKIVPPVPSLFTFNISDHRISGLEGLSVPKAQVKIKGTHLEQTGPVLITHWGLSGPAILKLSAWGARALYDMNYKAELQINWLADLNEEKIKQELLKVKQQYPQRCITTDAALELPKNLWKQLVNAADIVSETRWAHLSKQQLHNLVDQIAKGTYFIEGKSTYKQEFVTAGGIHLEEVNFKTMESRRCPGLYFAGEVLDIDGVTGGFNFQNAWTTGWIAGNAIANLENHKA
ncbi:MAG: hypothetical protein K0S74_136 [Chlamydiales bacterium]|jgi:predicted Rossmann fold flavoprotein|nr:hypothetical protein [Chlamydiales bacterium]